MSILYMIMFDTVLLVNGLAMLASGALWYTTGKKVNLASLVLCAFTILALLFKP